VKYLNSQAPAIAAQGGVTLNSVPDDGETITIAGQAYTFASGGEIDTVSGDTGAIAINLALAANNRGDIATFASGATVTLTRQTAGAVGNSTGLSTTSGAISLSPFSGGIDAGSMDGAWAGNFFSDSGSTVRTSDPVLTDDVTINDTSGAASGTGTCASLSSGTITGAAITVVGTCGSDISSGSVICAAFTGNQSGGSVQMKGSTINYSPTSYTGGSFDTVTYKALIRNYTYSPLAGFSVNGIFPDPGNVSGGGNYGVAGDGLSGTLVIDQPSVDDVLTSATSGGVAGNYHAPVQNTVLSQAQGGTKYGVSQLTDGTLALSFASADNVLDTVDTGAINSVSTGTGNVTEADPGDVLDTADPYGAGGNAHTPAATLPANNKVLRQSDGGPASYGRESDPQTGTLAASGGGGSGIHAGGGVSF
jgi:hypothetical protein